MRRKLAVILAADVASYSRLVADDEDDTLRRLNAGLDLFKQLIAHYGGRVFNTAGDAILAEFPSALEALRCAIELQESLKTRNLAYPPSRRLEFRVALHIGDVVEEGGNLLGDGVNVAARLEGIAPVGGICVSRIVHDTIVGKVAARFQDMGDQVLKNIPEPVRAYALPIAEPTKVSGGGASQAALPKPLVPASVVIGLGAVFVALLIGGSIWLFKPMARPAEVATPAPVTSAQVLPAPAPPVPAKPIPPAVEAVAKEAVREAPPAKEATAGPAAAEPSPSEPVLAPIPKLAAMGPVAEAPAVAASGDPLAERQLAECRSASVAEAVKACTVAAGAARLDAPRLAEAHVLLGNALRDSGDLAGATKAFDRSVEIRPTAQAFLGRGIGKFQRRDFDGAIEDFDRALDLAPTSGEALNNRAWARYRQGKYGLALADADKAVALLPAKSYVWDTRGHIHEALGNRELAIKDFRKAIAVDPASKSSQDGLARLLAKR